MTQAEKFEKLDELAEQIAGRDYLLKKKTQLTHTLNKLLSDELRLESQMKKETEDYEKMERLSLKLFMAFLSQAYEERKNKEFQEMRIAQYKHDEVLRRIENTRKEIERTLGEIAKLDEAKKEYERLFDEKLKWAEENHHASLYPFEVGIRQKKKTQLETREALDAAISLQSTLAQAEKGLSSAQAWGLYDIFGGGLISSSIKHDHISEAAEYLKDASSKAARLKRELEDIEQLEAVDLETIDSLSKVFDIFFDNIFSDLSIQSEINSAYSAVQKNLGILNRLVDQLKTRYSQATADVAEAEKARNDYLLDMPV
ncbi:MAG: hypothetical protein PWQ12_606 [Clostridiales bacterium]|nr:hypothetical protein [Clostridiales bacterium]